MTGARHMSAEANPLIQATVAPRENPGNDKALRQANGLIIAVNLLDFFALRLDNERHVDQELEEHISHGTKGSECLTGLFMA